MRSCSARYGALFAAGDDGTVCLGDEAQEMEVAALKVYALAFGLC